MKAIKLFIALALIVPALKAQNVSDLFSTNYISLTVPQNYPGELAYLDSSRIIKTKKAGEVPHDNTYLPSFPNLVSNVTLFEVSDDGTLSILGNSVTAKNHIYEVIYDYTQTQTIEITDASGSTYYALIGVSVRMVARIISKERGINIANLYNLGIAASRKKISGSLEVRVNGINSQAINAIIPVTADLSQASIGTALQAVATIKSHIYDAETRITPQFLAFSLIGNKSANKRIDYQELSNKVKAYVR